MKKIITYLIILSYTIVGFSQTKNDIIDFKNINLSLLDSLIFEEAMKERQKINISRVIHNDICAKAAKYQSEYSSYYDTISHLNNKKYKGNILVKPSNRFDFFLKQSDSKLKYNSKIEVIIQFNNVSSNQYSCITKGTYQDYAETIVKKYMASKSHKYGLLYERDKFGSVHGEFKTDYNSKTDCLTNTGFFVLVCEDNKVDKNYLDRFTVVE
jgi:hypothetical protein